MISFVLLLSSFSFLSFADTTPPECFETAELSATEVAITQYLCHESQLILPAVLHGKNVVEIADHTFTEMPLRSVVLPEGLRRIGIFAFSDTGLAQVSLPKTLKEIDDLAFWNNRLSTIDLPEGVERLGYGAFQINRLREVAIPDSVTEIGNFIFEENLLMSVTLSKNLKKIPLGAFHENLLHRISIPEGVEVIEDLAFDSNFLETVELPQGLKRIERGAFSHNHIESIELPKSLVNVKAKAFAKNKLTDVEVPGTTFLDQVFDEEARVTRTGPNYHGYWALMDYESGFVGSTNKIQIKQELFLSKNQKEYFIKETRLKKDGTTDETIKENIQGFISPEQGQTNVESCITNGGEVSLKPIHGTTIQVCNNGGTFTYAPVPFGYFSIINNFDNIINSRTLINFGRNE